MAFTHAHDLTQTRDNWLAAGLAPEVVACLDDALEFLARLNTDTGQLLAEVEGDPFATLVDGYLSGTLTLREAMLKRQTAAFDTGDVRSLANSLTPASIGRLVEPFTSLGDSLITDHLHPKLAELLDPIDTDAHYFIGWGPKARPNHSDPPEAHTAWRRLHDSHAQLEALTVVHRELTHGHSLTTLPLLPDDREPRIGGPTRGYRWLPETINSTSPQVLAAMRGGHAE